ncbi:uncharacterized protein ACNLHF_003531 [Anomaloglossus baeobatrachus]
MQGTDEGGSQWEDEGDMEAEGREDAGKAGELRDTAVLEDETDKQYREINPTQTHRKSNARINSTPYKGSKKQLTTPTSQACKLLGDGGSGPVQTKRTKKTAPPAGQDKYTQKLNVDYKKMAEEVASHLSKEIKVAIEAAIQTSLANMQKQINAHASRLAESEQRISDSEETILAMQAQIAALAKSNEYLKDKAEDLENRSRRNNLRIVGLPESVSIGQLDNICELELPQALGIKAKFRVERAHRVGPLRHQEANKGEGQNSNKNTPIRARQVIVKYLDYKHKEEILRAFRERKRPLQYQGNRLLFLEITQLKYPEGEKNLAKFAHFCTTKK